MKQFPYFCTTETAWKTLKSEYEHHNSNISGYHYDSISDCNCLKSFQITVLFARIFHYPTESFNSKHIFKARLSINLHHPNNKTLQEMRNSLPNQ